MSEFVNTTDIIGADELASRLIQGTLTEFCDNRVKIIGSYSFGYCSALERISCPAATTIRNYPFESCGNLVECSFPSVTQAENGCFQGCSSLRIIDLPAVKTIYGYAAFRYCSSLVAVILRNTTTVCTLKETGETFSGAGSARIYVPASLLDAYRGATNWSVFADRFRALEDYTVDGTVTGELDESKI